MILKEISVIFQNLQIEIVEMKFKKHKTGFRIKIPHSVP